MIYINCRMEKSKKKLEYTSMDQRSHVLHRPDMYIGSVKPTKKEMFIAKVNEDDIYISKEEIGYNPGLDRIFLEVLSNATDNVWRSKEFEVPCTKIKVNINKETGETVIWNDGLFIETEKNKETNLYNVEMIFGKLLTSSNYNDEEERKTAGRNGLGVKLCNIYSKNFTVKTVDPKNGKMYSQTWEENMSIRNSPKITSSKLKTGYTEISYIPDFSRFGCKGYSEEMLNIIYKHTIDCAMITKVGVYLNNVKIPVKNLNEYSRLFSTQLEDKVENIFLSSDDSEVVLTVKDESDNDYDVISYVNGIETFEGGVHVDSWTKALLQPIVEKINGKAKKGAPQITLKEIKPYFRLFLNCSVNKPEFTSQEKTKLIAPNVKVNVEQKNINTILKWNVIEKIKDIIRSKELLSLKKTEKKKGFKKIEGYDPANNAGGKQSRECTLILCEGLSAKTYAVQGIEVGAYGKKGRDWYGIYPLRGKILNTRNAPTSSISKNREITDIIQALNLKINMDYTEDKNFETLNYGKVMLMCDQDVDGFHISGLLINMFHFLFPTLLKREEPFLVTMKTPLVRIYLKGGKDRIFYSSEDFKNYYSKNQEIKGTIKYYKGLGTSSDQEIKDTFGKKMIEYFQDEKTDETLDKAFHKKYSDARKDWIRDYNSSSILLDASKDDISQQSFSTFIDNELILFSIDDCKRSIPNLMDGLKESHRKILYSAFLKNLKFTGKTLKVAQLAGFVAEKTNYHHGEQNLFDTITKMAHDFPGSNNIPLFFKDGQFGSRNALGKDAASARYIFTKLEALTRLIFRPEDDVLLERIEDEGELVEPKFYVPIIPMILANGCTAGIGTGWSCSIPNFNPLDLAECVKIWLENNNVFEDEEKTISKLPELKPYYRGFTGNIQKVDDYKYISYGKMNEKKSGHIEVDELPIGMATETFKEFVEDLLEDKKIKGYKNYSTAKDVNFHITESNYGLKCNLDNLKLKSYITTSNMVLFNDKDLLRKYNSIDEIIDTFCKVRFDYYIKRKRYLLSQLEEDLKYTNNRYRFLKEVMDGELIINKKKEDVIISELEEKGYDKKGKDKEEDEEDEGKQSKGYRYLLDMKIRSFTKEKLEELKNEIDKLTRQIKDLKDTSEKKLWLKDLDEFVEGYQKFNKIEDKKEKKIKVEEEKKVVKKVIKKIIKKEEEKKD